MICFGSVDGDEDLDTAITTVQEKTNDELLAVSILKDTMQLLLQSTPDNSNLQGKSKKGLSYREFKEIAESKVKKSFYCIVNILIKFNCRNVK